MTATLAIADAAALYDAAFSKGLRPETPISVSEWAERHRIISREGAAEPGPYRIDRTPYMRAIMDALSPDSGWSHVVFIKCAQIGFSEAGNNWVGYCIARDPGPMMVVQPRTSDAKDYVKQRLDPMIRDTPELRARIPPSKSRDGSNTLLQKSFPGGMLFISIANSAASLASKPIGKLMLDEVDRYPKDVDGEGDPVELAKKRTTTFLRKKILEGSTPTVDGASRIQTSYENSTKGRFFVPCPFCGEFQVLEWAGVRYDKNPDGTPILASTRYVCAGDTCGREIREFQKAEMLRRGEWRHENPKATSIGFHLSGLYSPWSPWSALVEKWHAAQGNPPLLKSFVNLELGECYTLSPEEKDAWQKVYAKREPYPPGVVPSRACLLTAGGDVQKDRVEISVFGWRGKECWLVEHVVIPGDTSKEPSDATGPWPEVAQLLTRDWPHAGGGTLKIARAGIDANYNTTAVYEFVRFMGTRDIIAVRGDPSGTVMTPIGAPKAQEFRTRDGKKIARGVKLYPVGTSVLKREIRSRILQPLVSAEQVAAAGYPANYFHMHEVSEDYCRQLTSEIEVESVDPRTKQVKIVWHKTGRNEALDTAVYAFACYDQLGAKRWSERHWTDLAAQLPSAPPPPPPPATTEAKPEKPKPAPKPERAPEPAAAARPRRSFWEGPER